MSEVQSVENIQKVSISVSPWTDKTDDGKIYFQLRTFQAKESVYGEIPQGRMELSFVGMKESGEGPGKTLVENQETGTVVIQDKKKAEADQKPGLIYQFNIFITERQYLNNILTLNFVVIPSKNKDISDEAMKRGKTWYTGLYSEIYDNIENAINAVYPGDIDKRCETSISDKLKVYRDNESGYNFTKRMAKSWKNGGIYAFGWDGLLFKERIGVNSFGKNEEEEENLEKIYGDEGDWAQASYNRLKYNKKHSYDELFNPWQDPHKDEEDNLNKSVTPDDKYKKWEAKLVSSGLSEREYKIHAKEYDSFYYNKDSNERFAATGGYSTITIVAQDMPRKWKLGDVILYERKRDDDKTNDVPRTRVMVASNEIYFSQGGTLTSGGPHSFPFEWTTILWGVDKLPVNEELEKNKENKESNNE